MLKYQPRRQNGKCLAIDAFGFDRNYRDTEEVSDGGKESLLVHFARIKDLLRPGTAIEVLRELDGFLPRRHSTFE